MILHQRIMRW